MNVTNWAIRELLRHQGQTYTDGNDWWQGYLAALRGVLDQASAPEEQAPQQPPLIE